ncbi:MAG TPA: NIPSNAP family protein [Bryobacteraceae bacterium]|nr:NIPSNAP family protein [Bryobacteraceae bacterium]
MLTNSLNRRWFLASSLATSIASAHAAQTGAGGKSREYYELRRYHVRRGPQRKLADDYFAQALIPALNRLGISPVGVFDVDIGGESPSLYALLPAPSVETLVTAEFRLDQDAEYLKAGAAFLNAPAAEPAYARRESSLMLAFEGMPRLTVPTATAEHQSRVFELRTYESPSDQDHKRKVEMFNSGEFDVFEKAGFWQVFYGDTVIGPRMPNLTYMIGFPDLAERARLWKAFGAAPGWKKLSSSPRYAFEEIVSNITNVILRPAEYSQI